MKKIMKAFLLTVPLLFAVLGGCTNSSENTTSNDTGQETAVSTSEAQIETFQALIVLKDGDEELTSKEVSFNEEQTLMEIMKENFEVEEDNGMITAIDGHEQDESASKYWVYTVNDEQVNEGAATKVLSPDDQVVFTLETF